MRILAIVTLLLCAGRVAAQDVTESDRFQLFNECRRMYLIALVNPAVGNEDTIETLVRRRLRAARLYSERLGDDTAVLQVVYGFGRNTPVRLSYVKHLYDPVSETYGRAPAWRRRPTRDYARARQHLSDLLDHFIHEYLRVNESACSP